MSRFGSPGRSVADVHQHKPVGVTEALVPERSAATASSGAFVRAKRRGKEGGMIATEVLVGTSSPRPLWRALLRDQRQPRGHPPELRHGRVLLAGDAEVREEHRRAVRAQGLKRSSRFRSMNSPNLRFAPCWSRIVPSCSSIATRPTGSMRSWCRGCVRLREGFASGSVSFTIL
jgi:hypothetical protein